MENYLELSFKFLSMKAPYLALDIGFTTISLALGDKKGISSDIKSVPTEEWWSEKKISELIQNTVNGFNKTSDNLKGIGAGVPGLVDVDEKKVIYSSHMDELDFTSVENELGSPICIENDANAAAMAERHYGEGQNCRNMAAIMIGSGVGGGVYYGGELLGSEEKGRSPEPGFVHVGDSITWQDVMGGESIPEYIESLLETENRETELDDTIQAEDLFDMAQSDAVAQNYLDELSDLNAKGIASVINLYAPEVITFSGSVAVNNPDFMESSFEKVEEYAVNPVPEMKISDLEENLGLYGGLALAARKENAG